MKTLKKVCSNIYLVFIFVLLYAPILTLMVLSFNQSKSRARWGGFTTRWYTELFQNEEILLAFRIRWSSPFSPLSWPPSSASAPAWP